MCFSPRELLPPFQKWWLLLDDDKPFVLKKNGGKRRRGPETPGKKFILPRRLPVKRKISQMIIYFCKGLFFEGSYPAPAYVPPPRNKGC